MPSAPAVVSGRALVAACVLAAALVATGAKPAPAAVPAAWPFAGVELGLRDAEHGAAALRARGRYGLRYHYLSGGVNTGQGWRTWHEGNGSFVSAYVADSVANEFVTVFSYYQLLQSAPALGQGDEQQAVVTNAQDAGTMAAYYGDLETFFRRAAESGPAILHVEPDTWGYLQRTGSPAVAVSSSGRAELADLPNTTAGLAQAIVRLRDLYAPDVLLAYHLSPWGSGIDPALSTHLDNDRVDAAAAASIDFYRSLGPEFDLVFAEFANRDAGYAQAVEGLGQEAIWGDQDFAWHARFIDQFAAAVDRSVVLWQIPFGNTLMRAVDNTPFHYQDNKAERMIGEGSGPDLQRYFDAGVIALLFGTAIPQTTCACDAAGDGVTNPAPINGNVRFSLSPDDDGGYFHATAAQWYERRQPQLADPTVRARARVAGAVAGERAGVRVRVRSSAALRAKLTFRLERRGKLIDRLTRPARLVDGTRRLRFSWRIPSQAPAGRAHLAFVVREATVGRTIAADPRIGRVRISRGG